MAEVVDRHAVRRNANNRDHGIPARVSELQIAEVQRVAVPIIDASEADFLDAVVAEAAFDHIPAPSRAEFENVISAVAADSVHNIYAGKAKSDEETVIARTQINGLVVAGDVVAVIAGDCVITGTGIHHVSTVAYIDNVIAVIAGDIGSVERAFDVGEPNI